MSILAQIRSLPTPLFEVTYDTQWQPRIAAY
jgi:hypothetical protein